MKASNVMNKHVLITVAVTLAVLKFGDRIPVAGQVVSKVKAAVL